jgi:hypothetical protein
MPGAMGILNMNIKTNMERHTIKAKFIRRQKAYPPPGSIPKEMIVFS